ELSRVVELLQQLSLVAPKEVERGRAAVTEVRGRVATSLKGRAQRTFEATRSKRADPLEALSLDSRRLRELENALVELSPAHKGLRQSCSHRSARRTPKTCSPPRRSRASSSCRAPCRR